MGSFSIWHWLVVIMVVGWAIAVGMILKRMGFSPAWAILSLFPLINLIGIWFLALGRWPLEDHAEGVADTFR